MSLGGIEAGGTRWNLAVSRDGEEIERVETIPTATPAETLARAAEFFAAADLEALGIGSFGPVEVSRDSPRFGTITTTPKPGWAGTDVVTPLAEALGVPIALDTDVGAAALGEWRHGAARGLGTFAYVTVGTGIGAGVFAEGQLLHGLMHPELGHVRVPHDRARDPFEGCCPFHGDCLEGLASGTALRERWGRPAEELDDPEAWELEAEYLALGLSNLVLVLAAERIVLGGGVGRHPGLIERVRAHLHDTLAGYIDRPQLTTDLDAFLVAPALGTRSALLGALHLARTAITPQ